MQGSSYSFHSRKRCPLLVFNLIPSTSIYISVAKDRVQSMTDFLFGAVAFLPLYNMIKGCIKFKSCFKFMV